MYLPTTLYKRVRDLVEGELPNISEEDFRIVLPVSQVVSISIFDHEVYTLFEALQQRDKARETISEK